MSQTKDYLALLLSWKDEPIIKAITGDPGSGKTMLLSAFQEHLRSTGVPDNRIVSMNFGVIKHLPNYHVLHNSIKERLSATETTYILLDEVQHVPGFEKVVASLYTKEHVDIYIAGPFHELLCGENATLLSGRYVHLKIESLA